MRSTSFFHPSRDRSMNPIRSLVTTVGAAALAFTSACASAPKARPDPLAAAPRPAPAAPQPAQPAAPSSSEEAAQALFTEALAAFDKGDWEAAKKGFRKVLGKLPDNFVVHAVGTYSGTNALKGVQLDNSGNRVAQAEVVGHSCLAAAVFR